MTKFLSKRILFLGVFFKHELFKHIKLDQSNFCDQSGKYSNLNQVKALVYERNTATKYQNVAVLF